MSFKTKDPKPLHKPAWDDYWRGVGNETWHFARELIELSGDVKAHFASFIKWDEEPVRIDNPDDPPYSMPDPSGAVWRDIHLDWKAAAKSADEWPASSTQLRLLALVLSLINPDEESHYQTRRDDEGTYEVWVTEGTRKMDARDLSSMGSWRDDVARILFRYISGQPHSTPAPVTHWSLGGYPACNVAGSVTEDVDAMDCAVCATFSSYQAAAAEADDRDLAEQDPGS